MLYQTGEITNSPQVAYPINLTSPGTYTLWLRGYASNAAGDSAYVGLDNQMVGVTGFAPSQWSWAAKMTNGVTATLAVTASGLYTVNVWMREDGLWLDRLLLTTNTTFIPTGFGPAESTRQMTGGTGPTTTLTHTIVYTYDNLYRLTNANYNTGETYTYSYDPVGNRLQQIINGDTTVYQYDAANRLEAINGQSNIFDANGNLKQMGVMTNTFDAANRLITTNRATTTLQVAYNGVGDRVAQTIGATTTHLALDVQGLPEVMYTSSGESYLHLPGVIMTEKTGQRRYLLPDGLGSIRQAIGDTTQVVAYYEFDPYGNPVNNTPGGEPYGYTGEWYEGYINLLHLRARWYEPETGTFLSRDAMESEPPYMYVRGNPVNYTDPTGFQASNPANPYDSGWCKDWQYPYLSICELITDSSTPDFIKFHAMRNVYQILELGGVAKGKGVNATFLSYFLSSRTEVTKYGSFWGNWLRTDTNFNKWHDAQLKLFLRSAVVRAAVNCQTTVGPWKVRELPHKIMRNGEMVQYESPNPMSMPSEDGALFSSIPIYSFESEVGTTLGKYWLRGDFYAENIRKNGSLIMADVRIKRFVDDVFDFAEDNGGFPTRDYVPTGGVLSYLDPGIGYVPNIWAQTLVEKGYASYFKIHIEWEEKFPVTFAAYAAKN